MERRSIRDVDIHRQCLLPSVYRKVYKFLPPTREERSFSRREGVASSVSFFLSLSLFPSFLFHLAAVMLIFPEKGRILEPNAFVLSSR